MLLRYVLCRGTLVPPGNIHHINPPITPTFPSSSCPKKNNTELTDVEGYAVVGSSLPLYMEMEPFFISRVPAFGKGGPKAGTSCLDLLFRLSQVLFST